jgi:CheY-like chemotaxis protein
MMHIDSYPFSVSGLFGSVMTMFKNRFGEKGIKVLAEVDGTLPDVLEGDPARLTQILMNLIGNALKFTSRGMVTIKISNEGMNEDIIQVGILVKDTGIGIQKDKLRFIFERFQQAEDSITRNYGGTGLGLAIVKDLVTLQNGSISVDSEPGKGTSFKLVIPYKPATRKIDPEPVKNNNITNAPLHLGEIEILVVEDNEVNKLLIRHLFKNWKVRYDMACNGRQAIEKLLCRHYSIILMDIQMPEMDGYTAAREIRDSLGLKTPIIAMTAHALQGEREKCLGCGMNDYISKPMHEMELYELIAHHTGIRPVTETAETEPVRTKKYEHIDLGYMKEVGNGNIEYEQAVTAEFLAMIPQELEAIRKAWRSRDTGLVKKLAHNMKTTISVMGLNERLQPFLDALEYGELNEDSFFRSYRELGSICEKALEEASIYYNTLPVG